MNTLDRKCPNCNTSFSPRRKNQQCCTDQCRIDKNNALAKIKYAQYKAKAPKLDHLTDKLRKLEEYINSLTIVLDSKRFKEVDRNTLVYQGRNYKKTDRIETDNLGVYLCEKGALLIDGNKIIYRPKDPLYKYSYIYEQAMS